MDVQNPNELFLRNFTVSRVLVLLEIPQAVIVTMTTASSQWNKHNHKDCLKLHVPCKLCMREVQDSLCRPLVQLQTMDVAELASILEKGPEAAQFIDVREPGEHSIAHLPHFELLPLSR